MSKLLLIGLDAADWKLLSEKVAQGKLPNLTRLIKTGASGPLRSLYPPFSPALWATIATGKRPYEHGIVGFTHPNETATRLQPYNSTSLRVPTVWDILSYERKKTHVIGWWNTAPAQAICGVMVDETFRLAQTPATELWSASPTSVSPPEFLEQLSSKRTHPQKLPESLLRRLIPKLYEINIHEDHRVAAIAKALAEDLTTLEVTLHLMRETSWDFTTFCFMGLDTLSHQGMNYRAPLLAALTPRDGELYGELVDHAYELYDQWIGFLVAAAGAETTIMILSDHGFYSDHRRVYSLDVEPTIPCKNHSPVGTLLLHGPSIKQGTTITHATLLDICPTILSFFDIPAGRDMPGKPLAAAFCKPLQQKRITSWDHLKKKKNATSSSQPSPEATQAALRQLVALGYLPAFSLNSITTLEQARCDQLLHTALAYLDDEQVSPALDFLEQAHQVAQQFNLARIDVLEELASLYWRLGKGRSAAAHFLQFVRTRRRDARQANQQLALKKSQLTPTTQLSYEQAWELRELIARAPLDEEMIVFIRALATVLKADSKAPSSKLTDATKTLFCLAEKNPHQYFMNLTAGKVALSLRKSSIGLRLLARAAKERPEEASALTLIAEWHNTHGSFLEAEKNAREALDRDPLHNASWLVLGKALLHQNQLEEAYQAALQARNSELHKSEFFELLAAIAAQKNRSPRRVAQYQALAGNARQHLEKLVAKNFHSKIFAKGEKLTENREPRTENFHNVVMTRSSRVFSTSSENKEYIVVTGLPRSGTSLLMQMLSAAGFPVMTDSLRLADQHNPRGYFEHESIKTIKDNLSLLQKGVAAKIVIPLLWELPTTLPVKLIFIQRDLSEVITSQHRMAGRLASGQELEQVYAHYLATTEVFLAACSWPVLRLSYAEVIAYPQESAQAMNAFLNGALSVEAMAVAVDPLLYRNRSQKS